MLSVVELAVMFTVAKTVPVFVLVTVTTFGIGRIVNDLEVLLALARDDVPLANAARVVPEALAGDAIPTALVSNGLPAALARGELPTALESDAVPSAAAREDVSPLARNEVTTPVPGDGRGSRVLANAVNALTKAAPAVTVLSISDEEDMPIRIYVLMTYVPPPIPVGVKGLPAVCKLEKLCCIELVGGAGSLKLGAVSSSEEALGDDEPFESDKPLGDIKPVEAKEPL